MIYLHYILGFIICLIFSFSSCSGSCQHDNITYMDGAMWNSSCSICYCHSGNVSCSKAACPAVVCSSSEVINHNSCCPKCVSYKRPCMSESVLYSNGDAWFAQSKCILYQCQDGIIVPHLIQCPSLVCLKEEKLVTLPGECCPICSDGCLLKNMDSPETVNGCTYINASSSRDCASISKVKENLIALQKDSCTLCVDEVGEMNCYARKCPLCASVNYMETQCCPCSKNLCSKECRKCSDEDGDICLECRDSNEVILDGQCISTCLNGFFEDEKKHCQRCPSICKTCFGNMNTQCSSCHSGFFLQKGRCVKTCSSNFYASGKFCFECHHSCSSCHGPNNDDCLTCSLSGQLLQEGKCVDNCSGHFYVLEDSCMQCNESCARCLKDGSCQFCEEGFYLEEDECVPECTPGYYTFLDAYCLSCHSECQGCYGPLPSQCTSCPFGQFLLENSCVWDCGQGYFGDLGAGICRTCHPDCRSCLGGSANDKCLTCSDGYLLPYIGTHFGPCVEQCPVGHYLSEDEICSLCHETCETCFGANDTDCKSCSQSLFYKAGRCVPHCSAGYFQDFGICYACYPSCSTCYGFTEDECYTCPFGRTFKAGKCVSTCENGQYLNREDSCISCHATCYDCMLDSTDGENVQCLQCKNQQSLILNEKCIPKCPSNFYLNSNRFCQECHPTCATCERGGATGCVNCWNGTVLTHLGTCEYHCHHGYYPLNGVCQACNSDCHHCIDASKCLQCKGDLVLEFGKCVSQCLSQHYIDAVSRQCEECSKECYSCRGPSPSDCLSCVNGLLFQVGYCVQHCTEGFYEKDGICESCDLKCKTCSSVNKCTSCDLPFMLLNGECVDDCGSGRYADLESLVCKQCDQGCAFCFTAHECLLCQNGFYLLDFSCVKRCPLGLYGDFISRLCKNYTDISTLSIKSDVILQIGQSILVSTELLNLPDTNTFSFFVFDKPKNAQLLKMSDTGHMIELKSGDNFTSDHLKDGWIFFKHLQGLPLQGNLSFKIFNGHLLSDEIVLPVHVASTFPPVIGQFEHIVVPQNSLIVVNSSMLYIEDMDNIQDVTLQVIQKPCNGNLIHLPDGNIVSRVSYTEFLQNKFAFKSSQKNTKFEDNFIIQVIDGFNAKVFDVKVIFLPQDHENLFIARKNPLYILLGKQAILNNHLLLSVGKELNPVDIQYFIQSSEGSFFKKNFSSAFKYEDSDKLKVFSQEDINREEIYYFQTTSSGPKSVVKFLVKRKHFPYEQELDFEIFIVKPENNTLNFTNEFGMMVLQNHPATISQDHLFVQIDNIPPSDIVYIITKKLLKSEGTLENLDKPGERLQSFSQEEINNMKIVYHPPPYAGNSERQFIFQFVVVDAISGAQLSPVQDFVITVNPSSIDFTSPASSIDHIATILVKQGQAIQLEPNWLSTVGHEMPNDQLEVILTNAPQHGKLIQINEFGRTEIEEEDGYVFTSIINDMYYEHDGSNNLHDSAVFSIMGGRHSSLNRVKFEIIPNDNESPVILDSTTLMGSVTEGKSLNIQRHHLAFTDLISGDKDITFTLLVIPKYGVLELKANEIYYPLDSKSQFTQQDINDLLIRYTANINIGDDVLRDFIHFDVSDASGNVQANQVLTIKVKPRKKERPTVKVNSDVQVNEGGEAVIEPHVITVFDPDSPLSDLIVVLDKQPDYGFIENSRPIPGAENTLAGIPISSFPYIDLVEGFIKYIQAGHQGVEPERDTVYIHLTDGYLSSESHLLNITIKPMNDETPHLFTDALYVEFNHYVKFSNSTLSVVDSDTKPNDLILSIEKLPQEGLIKILNQASKDLNKAKTVTKQDKFTFLEVLNGLLYYEHGANKPVKNDTLTVSVSDGHHTVLADLDVVILIVDREVPFMLKNLGLELSPGNSSVISNLTLSASDIDSPDDQLVYFLTSDPKSGHIYLNKNGKLVNVTSTSGNSSLHSFTQDDINHGRLIYHHYIDGLTGILQFTFNVADPADNTLLDQKFFITIIDDTFPPIVTRNTGLKVPERHRACITTQNLTAFDEHQKNLDLKFSLMTYPRLGYLENKNSKQLKLTNFKLSDLELGNICYIHSSTNSEFMDSFSFSVSDGKNLGLHTFYISIISKWSSLPIVKISPLQVEEGNKKIISEFELDILDHDTKDENVTVYIIKLPQFGIIKRANSSQIDSFTVQDLKRGNILYVNDGSETLTDEFTILISDGSNAEFIHITDRGNITSKDPIVFPIKILQVDDVFPILVKNNAVKSLKIDDDKMWSPLTENNILVHDADTSEENIVFYITLQPQFGFLQMSTEEGKKISNFTQKDISQGKVQYVLKEDDLKTTEDKFMFTIEDTKPNKVFNNIFVLEWSRVSFISTFYNASEIDGFLELPVMCTGYCDLRHMVSCKLSDIYKHLKPEKFSPVTNKLQFNINDSIKYCVFKLQDDSLYDGPKQYKVELQTSSSLIGKNRSTVIEVSDYEDEPTISFKEAVFKTNESTNHLQVPVVRKGDIRHELSLMCVTSDLSAQGNTLSGLKTGSDYVSRFSNYDSLITFAAFSSTAECTVQIIDDNLYEEAEEFLLTLYNPHPFGKIVGNSTAHIIIDGPNDVPEISIIATKNEFNHGENVSLSIIRNGVDLSNKCIFSCESYLQTHLNKQMILSRQITFQPFENMTVSDGKFLSYLFAHNFHVKVCDVFSALSEAQNSASNITIFLSSPMGCTLSHPYNITMSEKKLKPVIQFNISHINVKEMDTLIEIPVIRGGDLQQNSSLYCITEDGSAQARKDFEERYVSRRSSLITFLPGEKLLSCKINLYDDQIYEGAESFKVKLLPYSKDIESLIGEREDVVININDDEDVTRIELEKREFVVSQQMLPSNLSVSLNIPIIRLGDLKNISKIRVSTIDGSASSGMDYHAKSKVLTFFSGEKKKNFNVEILYNKRRNWAVSFTVILGPDEVLNAVIGNISKSVVRIAGVQTPESLILPTIPVVVSLLYYDNVTKGMTINPVSGYPLICVTPCDENYPDFYATGPLCKELGINSSSMKYFWEVAIPLGDDNVSSFERISRSTLFTSAYDKVLDSIYFRPQERVRCTVLPKDQRGLLGVPLKSDIVKISSDIGFCHSTLKSQYAAFDLQSQPFIATLNFVNSSDLEHPNQLHIHIEIPHEDGLIPLISTYPLHNIEYLLTQKIYRQQHVCSNLQISSSNFKMHKSFIKSLNPSAGDKISAFPYNSEKCMNETLTLYQHLNLKKCTWSFDTWYTIAELVQLCGGIANSDFKVRDSDQTYITVLLPLYVTYIFGTAPTGWTSVEHQTELEFSFFYNTFLWKSGSHSDSSLRASVSLIRIGINFAGYMFFEFKTVAKFYGCFVLDHHTLPDIKSYVSAPKNLHIHLNLELLWSEQTFEGPTQFWRATSNYNLKDYSGYYSLHMIPCKVKGLEYSFSHKYLPCIAQMPEIFELPVVFQRANRPQPVTYALETFFQIFNDKSLFLLNPLENLPGLQYVEYKGAFSKGDNIFGRVFWSPNQGLESAYKLEINEVILCSGKINYSPLYDPNGKIHGKGPQYGCLLPNNNFKYKFVLLDKHDSDITTTTVQGVPFNARFINDIPQFTSMSNLSGVDGFIFDIDPLYQISSRQEWFLQVVYQINPIHKSRLHRSLDDNVPYIRKENGTSIKMILLDQLNIKNPAAVSMPSKEADAVYITFELHHLLYLISACLIVSGLIIMFSKKSYIESILTMVNAFDMSHAITAVLDRLSVRHNEREVSKPQNERKANRKKTYQVKISVPNNKIRKFASCASETEV